MEATGAGIRDRQVTIIRQFHAPIRHICYGQQVENLTRVHSLPHCRAYLSGRSRPSSTACPGTDPQRQTAQGSTGYGNFHEVPLQIERNA